MATTRTLTGRTVIYTDADVIDQSNVVQVLKKALETHEVNKGDIQYLYDYYKGKQPILSRVKEIRPEICNRIVENRANEIVSFKVGYLMGEPVQYVSRGGKEDSSDAINQLNEYVFAEDKAAKDKELADWFTICGTAYRMVLPDAGNEEDEAPFEIYTLDPRYSFAVYHSGLGNKRKMGVKYIVKQNNDVLYSVYTDNMYFEILNDKVVKATPHSLGCVPIIEYPANSARLGAFEIVLPLLDAINEVGSNRLDGVEQFVQAILLLKGVDIESEDFKALKENGGLKVPLDGDAKYLVQELNQTQTQTLVDYMYQTVLTICGMPNRNGGSSTSDTGSAVIMRDGWSAAEARAKDTELMFKMSEKEFLRIVIQITNTLRDMDLRLSAIEIRFTRRNYENIQEKAQVLTMMLSNDKIHPRLAFEHSGLFVDPELAYAQSMEYAEEREAELLKELEEISHEDEDEAEEEEELNENV
jgi:SPP1 family phage portal protein